MREATILLVEDNGDDVLLARRAFRKAALVARLDVVEDGEQAIVYLSEPQRLALVVLVLMDWKLPRVSGREVLQWIRAHPVARVLPVAIVSSSPRPDDIEAARVGGADDYVQKPLVPETLQRLFATLACGPGPSAPDAR